MSNEDIELQTKERPILFSGEMVQTILAGRKAQTRRVIKPQPDRFAQPCYTRPNGKLKFEDSTEIPPCPYGQPGDRLWVREAFAYCPEDFKGTRGIIYRADGKYNDFVLNSEWCPSIHMPRKHSRILLEITSVRIERLRDISEADANAEGVMFHNGMGIGHSGYRYDYKDVFDTARSAYISLWDSINEKRGFGWKTNPWVWVIEFKRVEK